MAQFPDADGVPDQEGPQSAAAASRLNVDAYRHFGLLGVSESLDDLVYHSLDLYSVGLGPPTVIHSVHVAEPHGRFYLRRGERIKPIIVVLGVTEGD